MIEASFAIVLKKKEPKSAKNSCVDGARSVPTVVARLLGELPVPSVPSVGMSRGIGVLRLIKNLHLIIWMRTTGTPVTMADAAQHKY